MKFIITVRFPSWGLNDQYPAFGVMYLIQLPTEIEETDDIKKEFIKLWNKNIANGGKEFDGEILFIEESELVVLS